MILEEVAEKNQINAEKNVTVFFDNRKTNTIQDIEDKEDTRWRRSEKHWCDFLCLKYYRAPRYRMRYVIIVLIERTMFVLVQNCVRVKCFEHKL